MMPEADILHTCQTNLKLFHRFSFTKKDEIFFLLLQADCLAYVKFLVKPLNLSRENDESPLK